MAPRAGSKAQALAFQSQAQARPAGTPSLRPDLHGTPPTLKWTNNLRVSCAERSSKVLPRNSTTSRRPAHDSPPRTSFVHLVLPATMLVRLPIEVPAAAPERRRESLYRWRGAANCVGCAQYLDILVACSNSSPHSCCSEGWDHLLRKATAELKLPWAAKRVFSKANWCNTSNI